MTPIDPIGTVVVGVMNIIGAIVILVRNIRKADSSASENLFGAIFAAVMLLGGGMLLGIVFIK